MMMVRRSELYRSDDDDDYHEALLLLRGPIVVAVAIVSVLISVAQSLSRMAIIQIGLVVLGVAMFVYDTTRIGLNKRFRAFVRNGLRSIVWDDVMYKFFHPDVAWYKIFTETILGQAAWMYMLPSTTSQRTRLLQACLAVSEDQARHILFAPGGYTKLLLPKSFLMWLEEGDSTNESNERPVAADDSECTNTEELSLVFIEKQIDGDNTAAITSSSESSPTAAAAAAVATRDQRSNKKYLDHAVLDDSKADTDNPKHKNKESIDKTTNNALPTNESQSSTERCLPSISETMHQIVTDAVSDQLGEILQSYCPDPGKMATIGLAAAVSLAIQFRTSPQSRKLALGIAQVSSVLGLSTITLGAVGLAAAKVAFTNNNNNGSSSIINERNLHAYIGKVLRWKKALSRLTTINSGGGAAESGNNNNKNVNWRWKGFSYTSLIIIILGLGMKKRHRLRHSNTR